MINAYKRSRDAETRSHISIEKQHTEKAKKEKTYGESKSRHLLIKKNTKYSKVHGELKGYSVSLRMKQKRGSATAKQQPKTHTILCILVGPGIDQQPHTVGLIIPSSPHQRRPSPLRVGLVSTPHRTKTVARKMGAFQTRK
jgi:hypothetical protein